MQGWALASGLCSEAKAIHAIHYLLSALKGGAIQKFIIDTYNIHQHNPDITLY